MKAEIGAVQINCPLCGSDVEVPVMVEQGGGKKVSLTLHPDTTGLVAHLQTHMPDPSIKIEGDKIIHRPTGVADVERCWHGVPVTADCGICGGRQGQP